MALLPSLSCSHADGKTCENNSCRYHLYPPNQAAIMALPVDSRRGPLAAMSPLKGPGRACPLPCYQWLVLVADGNRVPSTHSRRSLAATAFPMEDSRCSHRGSASTAPAWKHGQRGGTSLLPCPSPEQHRMMRRQEQKAPPVWTMEWHLPAPIHHHPHPRSIRGSAGAASTLPPACPAKPQVASFPASPVSPSAAPRAQHHPVQQA